MLLWAYRVNPRLCLLTPTSTWTVTYPLAPLVKVHFLPSLTSVSAFLFLLLLPVTTISVLTTQVTLCLFIISLSNLYDLVTVCYHESRYTERFANDHTLSQICPPAVTGCQWMLINLLNQVRNDYSQMYVLASRWRLMLPDISPVQLTEWVVESKSKQVLR